MSTVALKPMPRLSAGLRRSIAWLGVALLFNVKINLITIEGQSAGLRLDDIVLLLVLTLIGPMRLLQGWRNLSPVERAALAVFGAMLLSNIINILFYGASSTLYSLRFLEYFSFFFIGWYFRGDLRQLCWTLLVVNGAVMILQVQGLVGGFLSEGLADDVTSRAVGLTGGPWEVGALINCLFAILIFTGKLRPFHVILLFAGTMSLVLLTAARMPTVAHCTVLLLYLYRTSSLKLMFFLKVGAIAAPLFLAIFLFPNNPVLERSEKLGEANAIDLLFDYYGRIEVTNSLADIPNAYQREVYGDASWLMRVAKWAWAAKQWTATPLSLVFGIGPGTDGVALDGGWLRVFSETGLLGGLFYIYYLKRLSQVHAAMLPIVIAVAISMFMIDIHMAYKAQQFVLFAAGYFTFTKGKWQVRQESNKVPILQPPRSLNSRPITG